MIRTVGLLMVLAVVGGGTFLGVRSWLTPPPPPEAPAIQAPAITDTEQAAVRVVIAGRRLSAGTLIDEADLDWLDQPTGQTIADSWLVDSEATLASLNGAVVRRWLAEGDPVTEAHVVRPGERGFLAAVLSPGFQAVTIAVSEAAAVAGLVFPGDRVDLVLSQDLRASLATDGGIGQWAAETVLADIRVVAINQSIVDQTEQPVPEERPQTVTLEVTPEQARIVTLAARMGVLSLALRSLPPGAGQFEGAAARNGPTLGSDVSRVPDILAPLPPPPPPPPDPQPRRVEVVRGGEASTVEFAPDSDP